MQRAEFKPGKKPNRHLMDGSPASATSYRPSPEKKRKQETIQM